MKLPTYSCFWPKKNFCLMPFGLIQKRCCDCWWKKKDSAKRKVVLQWHLEFIPTWLYFKRDQETIPEHKQNVQEYRSRKIWSVFWESQVVELFWCFCGLGEEPEEKAWSASRSIYMTVELLTFALKLCLPTNWSLGRFAVCIHFRQVLQKNTKPWF